jgi:hypothetical protein
LESHLKLEKTIGLFSKPYSAKFVCFDLDMGDSSEKERRRNVNNIINNITKIGISRDYIHISFSGKKGYHIYLMLDKETYHTVIYNFYSYILVESDLTSNILEIRPLHDFGVKLPLGLHRNAKKMSYFVDENFNRIDDPLYITRIKQFPSWLFCELISDIKLEESATVELQKNLKYQQLSPNKLKMLSNKEIMDIESNGLRQKSTRNLCSTQLAMFYRNQGLDYDEALKRLNNWISCQDKQFYSSSLEFCFKENQKIIKWAYSKPLIVSNKILEVKIYKSEMKRVLKIPDIQIRKVFLAILIHGKIYKNKQNKFSMTYDQIKLHSGIKSDKTISKAIKHLKEINELAISYSKGYNKISNVYSIKMSDRIIEYIISIEDDVGYYTMYPYDLSVALES